MPSSFSALMMPGPRPAPAPQPDTLADLRALLAAEGGRPEDRPAALPCVLTTYHKGQPALGTAILDAEVALDPALPLELVPPEEAARTAGRILRKGGHYILSDDYLRRYPQSQAAQLAHAYIQRRGAAPQGGASAGGLVGVLAADGLAKAPLDSCDVSLTSAGASTSTAGCVSLTGAPRTKKEQVQECIHEAVTTSRPIFRPQDPSVVYGKATYLKRNFHETMDQEHPIEYII